MEKIPRPKKRTIRHEPEIHYFSPQRFPIVDHPIEQLTYDELEAMRLKHTKEKHTKEKTQEQCAKLMNISQSTFSRILEEAHRKVTSALVEGKTIHLIGGEKSKLFFYGYGCRDCTHEWNIDIDEKSIPLEPNKDDVIRLLPLENVNCTNPTCKSVNIYRLIRDVIR